MTKTDLQIKKTAEIIRLVGFRMTINRFFYIFYRTSLWLGGIFILGMFIARFTAVIPDVFTWQLILLPYVLSVICALISLKKTEVKKVAQKIDKKYVTNDLFLTAITIEKAQGEYKQLVLDNAEKKAQEIRPENVVLFHWSKPFVTIGCMLIFILLSTLFIPQFDPFGKNKKREEVVRKKEELDKLQKATIQRLRVLKEKPLDKNSPEVMDAIRDLKSTFSDMKKNKLEQNLKKLKEMQSQLNKLWKKKHSDRLRDLIDQRFSKQSFGSKTANEKQMAKDFKKGNVKRIKRELKKLMEQAKDISKMKDSAEKRKKIQQLRKSLKKMSEFLRSTTKSDQVSAAMKRAMKQMDNASMNPQNKQSLENMSDSMKLAQRELEKLGQTMRDIKKLEDAMKSLQSANQANQKNSMESMDDSNFEGLQDYKDYFDQLQQAGNGKGKNGKGQGRGGGNGTGMADGKKVDENPDAETKTRMVKGRGKLQAGKILMKWNIKELSKPGQVRENYLDEIKKVKQSANEAILKEQVPPGYHDSIKNYFNSLDKDTNKSDKRR